MFSKRFSGWVTSSICFANWKDGKRGYSDLAGPFQRLFQFRLTPDKFKNLDYLHNNVK